MTIVKLSYVTNNKLKVMNTTITEYYSLLSLSYHFIESVASVPLSIDELDGIDGLKGEYTCM